MKIYPGIYVSVLLQLDRPEEAKDFMDGCKLLRYGECDQFSLYVHGYLLPWHQKLRQLDKLTPGKSSMLLLT